MQVEVDLGLLKAAFQVITSGCKDELEAEGVCIALNNEIKKADLQAEREREAEVSLTWQAVEEAMRHARLRLSVVNTSGSVDSVRTEVMSVRLHYLKQVHDIISGVLDDEQ